MKNLRTLYFYELKKLCQRKLVWITTALFFLVITVVICSGLMGNFYANDTKYISLYKMMQIDKSHELSLTGKKVDQELLESMMAGYLEYEKLAENIEGTPTQEESLQLADAHMTYCRPYKSIFDLTRKAMGMTGDEVVVWEASEEDFYNTRRELIEQRWETYRLTETEKAYWNQKEEAQEEPFTYAYKSGYAMLLSASYALSTFTILLIGVALSGMFADEHTLKTDQLLLASAQGRSSLYRAKLLAGISFSAGAVLIMTALAFGLTLGIYGTEGFTAAIQLVRPYYSYPISVGEFALITYGLLLLVAILVSLGVMFLSELFHSSIAALAITVAAVILGLFANVPERYRFLSQLWDLLPVNLLFAGNLYDVRLIPVFGHQLTVWQAMPVLYLLVGGLIAIIGKHIYRRYQVSGR